MCSKDFSSCIFDKGVEFHKKLPSDGGSIFISSTCYDLLDLRSELYRYLRSLGLHPRLSEFGYSDFAHPANHNAIETCLFNVDQADAYVLICHQRYGKEIDNIFWPISATHAEFCAHSIIRTSQFSSIAERCRYPKEHTMIVRRNQCIAKISATNC